MKGRRYEKFVRQSQTIKVTNVNNKVQTEKEVRKQKHVADFYTRCYLNRGPSNCDKTNVLISLLESPHSLRFENVHVLEVVAITKYSIGMYIMEMLQVLQIHFKNIAYWRI